MKKSLLGLLVFAVIMAACGGQEVVDEGFVDDGCVVASGQYLCQLVQSEDDHCVLSEEYDIARWLKMDEPCLCGKSVAKFMETKGDCDWSCSWQETFMPGEIDKKLDCTISCQPSVSGDSIMDKSVYPKDMYAKVEEGFIRRNTKTVLKKCSSHYSCKYLPAP